MSALRRGRQTPFQECEANDGGSLPPSRVFRGEAREANDGTGVGSESLWVRVLAPRTREPSSPPPSDIVDSDELACRLTARGTGAAGWRAQTDSPA